METYYELARRAIAEDIDKGKQAERLRILAEKLNRLPWLDD
jgi:hypothetical protein